jgi:hypothetical protein
MHVRNQPGGSTRYKLAAVHREERQIFAVAVSRRRVCTQRRTATEISVQDVQHERERLVGRRKRRCVRKYREEDEQLSQGVDNRSDKFLSALSHCPH